MLIELVTIADLQLSTAFPPVPYGDMLIEERIIIPPRYSPPPACDEECEVERRIRLYERLHALKYSLSKEPY